MYINQLSAINLTTDSAFALAILSLITLATYATASLSFFGLTSIALRGSGTTLPLQIAISLACGPMSLAWLLGILLRVAPGNHTSFYTSFIFVILIIGAVIGLTYLYKQMSIFLTDLSNSNRRKRIYLYGFGLLILCCFLIIYLRPILVLNLVLPVVSNDALDYFTAARLVFEQASLVNYPFIDSNKSGGFYGYWTHPPGFTLLLAWSNFLQDHSIFAGGGRITALWHYGALLFLIFAVAMRAGFTSAFAAVLFLLATPFFANNAISMHIDTTRIAIFTAAIASILVLLDSFSFKRLLLAGYIIGLAQFVHSIGILVLFLSIPAYFFLRQLPWNWYGLSRRLFEVCALTTVCIIVVLPDHLVNLQVYGTLIKDKPEVWEISHLDVRAHRDFVRMIATPSDMIFNGFLKGFTNVRQFSYTYWAFSFVVFLCSMLCYRRISKWVFNMKNPKMVPFSDISVLALFFLGFYAIVLLSVFAGSDLIIKNTRYLATPHGLIAILFGFLVATLISDSVEINGFSAVRAAVLRVLFMIKRWLNHLIIDISRIALILKSLPARSWLMLIEKPFKSLMAVIILVAFGWVGQQTIMDAQSVKLSQYKLYRINSDTNQLDSKTKIALLPGRIYKLISYINQRAENGDWPLGLKVLTFRKADAAFYLDVPYMAYLDSKLVPFYKAQSKEAGIRVLRGIKIGYVITPPYSEPTVYNSVLQDIIGDPLLATLLVDKGGYKLFKINLSATMAETTMSDVLLKKPEAIDKDWYFWDSEKRDLADFALVEAHTGAVTIFNSRGARRDNSRRTRTWTANCETSVKANGMIPGTMAVSPGTFHLSTNLNGGGYLKIWIWEMKRGQEGSECNLTGRRYVVWEGLLDDGERRIEQQFIIPPSTSKSEHTWTTMFELIDGGRVSVADIQIRRVLSSGSNDVKERH